ncbi:hypothetical protein IWQ60_005714 [Tieghemiomyces parasiticus]|uniref:Small ribosomal subunit protein uS7 domain-containing protein n=1 Tax=Tieghemiomyces parasiticus TaxID=78921 RepID=A0A9W8DST9_9FUNG|nr:hypothetical protein IWQ60_005714 [Tieghemiomyces parasiticus]
MSLRSLTKTLLRLEINAPRVATRRALTTSTVLRTADRPLRPMPSPIPQSSQVLTFKEDYTSVHPTTPGQSFGGNGLHATAPEASVSEATLGIASGESVTEQDRLIMKNDPLLSQVVNTLMRDGRKALMQRLIGEALIEIRRQTNANPYTVFRDALDMCSPLMGLTSRKLHAKVVRVPQPLGHRQRIRRALLWVYKATQRRSERTFPKRLSGEILDVINGRSAALKDKLNLHKDVMANRAYIQAK